MGPLLKTGKGEGSWTTTLVVFYAIFYWAVYLIGIFASGTVAEYSQKAWTMVDPMFITLVIGYCLRRGTEVYERVKNGKGLMDSVKAAIDMPDEEKDEPKTG